MVANPRLPVRAFCLAALSALALAPAPAQASDAPVPGACVLLSSGGGVNEWMCVLWGHVCAGMLYEVENGENSRGFSKGVCADSHGVAVCDARWDTQGHPDDTYENCVAIVLA